MKQNGIFIDYRNKKQVEWWNKIASKLAKVDNYNEIVETATGKAVGIIIALKGPFKNYVIKKNAKFISNPKTMSISMD